ncbi:hypothetical protein ACF1G5_37020 [Streptomyces coeruleorubidus]|uniref:hypothetical protein n=1 Tax=Streptomyces coeruleorubidus TaxID=116188 RepID=UPI003701FA7D
MMGIWASGRVVLLGDAGDRTAPTSGRGTSQALIGAYVPAGGLARADSNHTAAFIAYEKAIRPFVTEHQAVRREGAQRFFKALKASFNAANSKAGRAWKSELRRTTPCRSW